VTDEEVFQVTNADVFDIHIGEDGQTTASYYLNKQTEMLGLLDSMVGVLELECEAETNISKKL
jgi:trehalose 6-phosphate phosphatase